MKPTSLNSISTLAFALCAGSVLAQPAVEDELGMLMKSNPLVADLSFSFDTLGSDFDTEIAIWQLNGNLGAENDDAVPGSVLQSSLGVLFPPGVYYASVSGYDTVFGSNFQADTNEISEGGNVTATLNVEGGSQIINIDTTIQPGDFNTTPGEVKYYRFQIPGLFEHEDLGTVSYDGFVEINTCGSDFDTEIGLWNLDTGELIDFNDDAADNGGGSPCDGSLQSYLDLRLPTGRYALSVSGFGTEFDEGFVAQTTNTSNSGAVSLDVNGQSMSNTVSTGGEVEWYTFNVVALPAGASAEGEPDCVTLGTDINRGCNGNGSFGSISMGETIVGSGGGGLNGSSRDVDWYELVITEPTAYTLSIESEFPVGLTFAQQTIPGTPGCANTTGIFTGLTDIDAFDPTGFSGTLNPGTYYVVVANTFGNDASDCGGKYALNLRHQIPNCPPGSHEEQEPVPFDNFVSLGGGTNDACIFGGLSPEDVNLGDTICGTTGTYYEDSFASNFGDQDFYRFNVPTPTIVEAEIVSTTKVRVALTSTPLPATDFCSIILGGGNAGVDAEPGETARVRIALQPGDHSLQVLAEPFAQSGTASGSPYIVSLKEYDCAADTNLDGQVTPTDFTAWVNAFNNNQIQCDQNGDGNCTPTDFTAWIANYNQGCPQ